MTTDPAEEIAEELRRMAGGGLRVGLPRLARSLGVTKVSFSNTVVEGRVVRDEGTINIELREDRSLRRKRFTLAHELTHVYLDYDGRRARYLGRNTSHKARWEDEELLCDAVAGALLLPTSEVCAAARADGSVDLAVVMGLADSHRLSYAATVFRCVGVLDRPMLLVHSAYAPVNDLRWNIVSKRPPGYKGSLRPTSIRRESTQGSCVKCRGTAVLGGRPHRFVLEYDGQRTGGFMGLMRDLEPF